MHSGACRGQHPRSNLTPLCIPELSLFRLGPEQKTREHKAQESDRMTEGTRSDVYGMGQRVTLENTYGWVAAIKQNDEKH